MQRLFLFIFSLLSMEVNAQDSLNNKFLQAIINVKSDKEINRTINQTFY